MTTSSTALKPGDMLGGYQLLLPIGAGGMGRVWVAREQGVLGRTRFVAIKTALSENAATEGYWKVLLDEARIASMVQHPNVCAIHALERERGVVYLVMDYSDGGSLRELLDALPEHRLECPMAARIVASVCTGLHAAHELVDADGTPLGVVHRDVSPQNVLISSNGQVKITDFGVAKARGQIHAPTQTGEVKGKLSYMAPEQVTTKDIDRRADVFALGCVLYEATVGERPFQGEDALATLYQLLEQPLRPPSERREGYPNGLEKIVLTALARAPEERFQTTEEMARALERWLASEGVIVTDKEVAELVKSTLGERIEDRKNSIDSATTAIETGAPVEVPLAPQPETLSGTSDNVAASPGKLGKHPLRWAAVAGVAAVLSLGVALAARGGKDPGPPPAGSVLATEPANPPPVVETPPPVPERLVITLRAEPAHAILYLDDGPALPNPYQASVSRDERPHVLRARAPGYLEQSKELRFDQSKEVLVVLPKEVEAAPKRPPTRPTTVRTTTPQPAVTPTRVPGELPTVTRKAPRPLDPDNPFDSP
ncbi:MAG TPA: serine/threonine-protein kinase [Polyangiaceae bacterium]|nr:serine/threonine-protein kinase [Polyangiaceae bacterium]